MIVLFVEGNTEAKTLGRFIKTWLDPQLKKPIRLEIIPFKGEGDFRAHVKERAEKYANNSSGVRIDGIFGLLDLYGFKGIPTEKHAVKEKYVWAKKLMENQVGLKNYYHFFAVHELEAWLLSDCTILPQKIRKDIDSKCNHPEEVNFDEPPAKLLARQFHKHLGKKYKKTVEGPKLFNRLDPNIAYSKCPYLQKMLDKMLELAQQAEASTVEGV